MHTDLDSKWDDTEDVFDSVLYEQSENKLDDNDSTGYKQHSKNDAEDNVYWRVFQYTIFVRWLGDYEQSDIHR